MLGKNWNKLPQHCCKTSRRQKTASFFELSQPKKKGFKLCSVLFYFYIFAFEYISFACILIINIIVMFNTIIREVNHQVYCKCQIIKNNGLLTFIRNTNSLLNCKHSWRQIWQKFHFTIDYRLLHFNSLHLICLRHLPQTSCLTSLLLGHSISSKQAIKGEFLFSFPSLLFAWYIRGTRAFDHLTWGIVAKLGQEMWMWWIKFN